MLKISRSNYEMMPWKNGRGITAEIDRVPNSNEPYLWRLSQASIQTDGPFSVFPGYDRWLAVLNGDPIFLNDWKVTPLEPIRFSGDEHTFCKLSGSPVQDLGFIFDRTKVNAKMSLVEGNIHLPESCVHYIFDIESGDTIKLDHTAELSVGKSLLVSVWKI